MLNIKIMLLPLCAAILPNNAAVADPGKTQIVVTITNLKTTKGELRCALFRSADGFPRKPERAAFRIVGGIEGKTGRCVFADIPPGPSAITVIHDENNNKKLDMRMGLIPTEGIGWSNNPKVSFGPPSIAQARFVVGAAPINTSVKLNQR